MIMPSRQAVYLYLLENVVPLWDLPDYPCDISSWEDVEDSE